MFLYAILKELPPIPVTSKFTCSYKYPRHPANTQTERCLKNIMQRDTSLTAHVTSRLFPRESNATVVLTVSRAEKVHHDSYVTVRVGDSSTPPVLSDSARGVAPFVDAVVRHRVRVNTRRGKGYVKVGIHMADGLGTPLGSTRLNIIRFVMDGERRSNGWPIRVRVGDDAVIVGFIKCIVDATEHHGSSNNRTGQPTTTQAGDEETTDNKKWFVRRTKSLYHKSPTADRGTQPDRASKSLGNWTISSPIQFGKNIDRQRSRGDAQPDDDEVQQQEHSQEENTMDDSSNNRTWRSMSLSWASSTQEDATADESDDNTNNRASKIRGRLLGIRLGRRREESPESDTEHTDDSMNVSMSDIESDSEQQVQQHGGGVKATDTAEAEVAELKRENKQLRRAAAQKRAAIKAENAWLRRRAAVLREAVFREPVAATVAHDLEVAREQMAVVQAERDLLAQQAQLALGSDVNVN